MAYRKFLPDQLFDGHHFRPAGQVLITDDDGVIKDIMNHEEAGEGIQHYSGILTPGFINCHCHLELSHLKNVIPPHTGLIEFLCTVVTQRDFDPAIIQREIINAEKEMLENGIVAVGDIGNTADTADIKSRSRLRWQNFVEVLSFTDEAATENFSHYKTVAQKLETALRSANGRHRTSLVPHAPYSISPLTFKLINEATAGQVISIHNQEHPAEDELYRTGGGEYLKLFRVFGMDQSPFPVTGKSSIRSVLPYFNKGQTVLLIHNSYMPEEDIVWANEYASVTGLKLVYCLCINANLYIENKVPPVDLFIKHDCAIVLGTDSYSSNWQLSIAKEMEAIRQRFPHIPAATILQWATGNGADALQWEEDLGRFDKGKRPGVLLTDENFSSVKRLV